MVFVGRCSLVPNEPPWVEHEDQRLKLRLADPKANASRASQAPEARYRRRRLRPERRSVRHSPGWVPSVALRDDHYRPDGRGAAYAMTTASSAGDAQRRECPSIRLRASPSMRLRGNTIDEMPIDAPDACRGRAEHAGGACASARAPGGLRGDRGPVPAFTLGLQASEVEAVGTGRAYPRAHGLPLRSGPRTSAADRLSGVVCSSC